jgi:hypothetical protein
MRPYPLDASSRTAWLAMNPDILDISRFQRQALALPTERLDALERELEHANDNRRSVIEREIAALVRFPGEPHAA